MLLITEEHYELLSFLSDQTLIIASVGVDPVQRGLGSVIMMKLAKDMTNVRTNNAPVKVNFGP